MNREMVIQYMQESGLIDSVRLDAEVSREKALRRASRFADLCVESSKYREIGVNINRAAEQLPPGTNIHIDVERGAGVVTWEDDDGAEHAVHSDEGFAQDIAEALAAAIRARKGAS